MTAKSEISNLDERDIHIEIFYENPVFLRRIFGLYTIKVNQFKFKRFLRLTDFDGWLPSVKSAVFYPFIMFKYFHQKVTKRYVVKSPKPFIVVDAVDYIEKFIGEVGNACKVLEVGAGNSSLWFLKKGCSVLSFEHNAVWADDIVKHARDFSPDIDSKFKIEVCQGFEALKKMSDISEKFDIVLIDSMNEFTSRFEVIKLLKSRVSANGILILDNSDGPVNWRAMAEMQGVKGKRFTGYAYNCPVVSQTTIWHAKDF